MTAAASAPPAPTLVRKPQRTVSGVAVVAVMSSPAGCPHGKCTFCPGGPEIGVPQSYTGFEPSTMRAIRMDYDPYRIVRTRLAQLENNGHTIDKVEGVIQGGTFPAREPAYQDWFVASLTAGLNDGPGDGRWDTEQSWAAMAPQERTRRLSEVQRTNESARCRLIGLTVETKPDWCFEEHLDRMLAQGATRVEIGLQALDDRVLTATNRGHTLADGRRAMQLARDAGFKVCVHMMPGLPRGRGAQGLDPDPEADVVDARILFEDEAWRPDMMKIYPTLVVEEGETLLKRQWKEGKYHPYDAAAAASVVARMKAHVPEWCRIQRVDRDIPTTHIVAGVEHSNLRQMAQAEMRRLGLPSCRCIRCREAGRVEGASAERAALVERHYSASGGQETFLAFEDRRADAVLAFLRLRRPGWMAHRGETKNPHGVAIVRELKVLGTSLAIGEAADGGFQHRGFGTRLLREAERIAFDEWRVARILVIAGPGVKPYYRRLGYADDGPYVAKEPGG